MDEEEEQKANETIAQGNLQGLPLIRLFQIYLFVIGVHKCRYILLGEPFERGDCRCSCCCVCDYVSWG